MITLCVIFSPFDADPAGAIAADGLHVGLVGLQLHGGGLSMLRCAGAQRNYGQIIGFHPCKTPSGGALKTVQKSAKLANVLYDIRGPIMDAARQMEEEGHKIIKLNIGNLAVFGFDAPEEIQQDMIRNLPNSAGYSDSKGIFAARKAVMHYTPAAGHQGRHARRHLPGQRRQRTDRDGHQRAAQRRRRTAAAVARLPAVDGRHQRCRAARRCTTCATKPTAGCPTWRTSAARSRRATKGIVVINPNNPTGALYSDELLKGIVRDRARARPGDPGRRGLRQGAVRRREAHGHRQPVGGRAHADVQLAVQELPLLRLPRRLDGGVGRQEAPRPTTSRA